ncbi:MAG: SpoVG family protein [Candidatus Omnitrophota bacterium]
MELEFKVARLHKFDGSGAIKAICDISISGQLVVKGFKIIEGKNGLFVGLPQDKGKNGKWYDNVFPLSPEVRETISKTVLSAYQVD